MRLESRNDRRIITDPELVKVLQKRPRSIEEIDFPAGVRLHNINTDRYDSI